MKSVSGLRVTAVLSIVFALVSSVLPLGGHALEEEAVADSALSGAEDSMDLAYKAVLEAEGAGANVSRLLASLNVAGEYLARAHMALRKRDYADVIEDANRSKEITDGVKADAVEFKELASEEKRQERVFWTTRSMMAIGVIGVGSVVSWYVFKGRYNQRISEKKIKADEDGA